MSSLSSRDNPATVSTAFERAQKRFNLADTLSHIEILTGSPDSVVNLRTIPESPRLVARIKATEDSTRQRFKYEGTFSELAETARRRNAQGYAVYITVNETDGLGVKRENITRARVLVLDLDGAPLPTRWTIEPHLIVESSAGKFQCTWRIQPTRNIEVAEHIGKRLALHYKGDPKVFDAPHVFRLAGFVHQKRTLFTSRIIKLNEWDAPATLQQFDAFLPKLPPRPPRAASSRRGVGDLTADHVRLLIEHYPVDAVNSNAKWEPFAMALHAACDGDEDAAELFFEWCMTDSNYANDTADAWNRLRWNSFDADKPGGVGIGTLRKLCRENGVPGAICFTIFNAAAKDFD